MNLEKSRGLELVPREPPPEELTLSLSLDPMLELKRLSIPSRNAVLWTEAIRHQFWRSQSQLWRSVRGFRFATCGFTDPEIEGDAFSVIIYASPTIPFDDKPSSQLSELKVGKEVFPVYIRYSFDVLHGKPDIHPWNGTSACWAEAKKPKISGRVGIITAKHLISPTPIPVTIGNKVPMIHEKGGGEVGTILDIGPEGIDAIMIEPPNGFAPQTRTEMPCPHLIAQWTEVSFKGVQSNTIKTRIVEVQLGRGSLDFTIPLRFFIAEPGKPGDSGSLVLDMQDNGLGIYMGAVANLVGHTEGYCQHLQQVAHVMNVKPLK